LAVFGWKEVSLDNKITILGGSNLIETAGNLSILMKKIYQRYHTFKDLQFVMLCLVVLEDDVKSILDALDEFTDVSQWHFCLLLLKRLTHITTN
jgi:hypothetical protein